MKALTIVSFLVALLQLTACGGSGSANSSGQDGSVGGSAGNVVINGQIVDGLYLNGLGQIADPQAFCSDMWDISFAKIVDGYYETYRTTTNFQQGAFSSTVETAYSDKTATSYRETVTSTSFGQTQSTTEVIDRNTHIAGCVDSITALNNGEVPTQGEFQGSINMSVLNQGTETITVEAGTFNSEFYETSTSINSVVDGQDYQSTYTNQSWIGVDSAVEGMTLRLITTTDNAGTGVMVVTVELIEFGIR